MKRLKEALNPELRSEIEQRATKFLQERVQSYDGKETLYPDLAIWLGCLRGLAMIHHTHHWQTRGKEFYGDHLLLDKLYTTVEGEVDPLGERIVGLDSSFLVNYCSQIKHMMAFMKLVTEDATPLQISLLGELMFISIGEIVLKRLKETDLLTSGLSNLMEGMMDTHEVHVYLLQQRIF